MNKLYVKFIGKFRDLKPNGWEFQKLFANNYCQYCKTCDGQKWSQELRIWKHLGGYLEIADLYDKSYLIVKSIIDGTIETELCYYISSLYDKNIKEKHYHFYISKSDDRLINFYSDEGRKIESDKFSNYEFYLDNYREFILNPLTIDLIKDLLNKKMIEIQIDNRVKK
jgi:hypothetical protein